MGRMLIEKTVVQAIILAVKVPAQVPANFTGRE
jgi:hypothetical protein